MEWAQVEFGRSAALHVRRAKGGKASVHPIRGYELRMLTSLRKAFPDTAPDAVHHRRHQPADQEHRQPRRAAAPLPHAAPLLRLQAGQRRDRYQGDPRLARPRVDHAHHALHTNEPGAVQGFLAGLIRDLAGAGNCAGRGHCRIKRGPFHTAAGREYDDGGSWSGSPLSPLGPVSRIHRGSRLRPDAICQARDELWRHPNVQNETIAIFWRRNLDTVLIREHYNRTLPVGDSLCVRLVKR